MRFLAKPTERPKLIQDFIDIQMAQVDPVNLDYRNGFGNRKRQLLTELIAEQFGLCAYTGLPVDERLEEYNTPGLRARNASYRAHNEHIKAQSVCEVEAGDKWGRQPCEDIDHRNIVAAVEVRGASSELFGAVVRSNVDIRLPPTNPDCEVELIYTDDGQVIADSERGNDTIDRLKLNHETLKGYRRGWLASFLAIDSWKTRDDLIELVRKIESPVDGKLTKFSFCIASTARQIIKAIDEG